MPVKNERYWVYPDPKALPILGGSASPTLNKALERWADTLQRNEVTSLDRSDWLYLADTLNGTWFDRHWSGMTLAAEVEDADRLNGYGAKWYGKSAKTRVAKLIAACQSWSSIQAWSVITAVEYFWEHHQAIDAQKDEWWTIAFRIAREASRTTQEDARC